MKKARKYLPWCVPLGLLLLSILVYGGIPGFSFTAYILAGLAGLSAAYLLLGLLKNRKAARIMTIILSICICIGLVAAAITGWIIYRAGLGQPDVECGYVIVLGAGLRGTTPSMILTERLNAAYEYLSAHPDVIAVVSGGQGAGEDIPEAKAMFDYLTGRGIPAERVWMEDQSTNSRENLQYSLALIESRTGARPESAGILSNEFHLYRAGLFAREQNLTAIGIPAKTQWASLFINYFLREIVAVWYYTILGG